jgi:hypothetical protein
VNHTQAVVVASAAAEAAFRILGHGRIGWYWFLGERATLQGLSDFVQHHPGATVEELYRFGSSGQDATPPWDADEALAAAVETFDATLRKMLSRVERDAAFPSPSPEGKNDREKQ